MPDWTYRTLFQPLLFRLPTEFSRDLALGAMGRLAALPGGPSLIGLMGHMAPDRRLETPLGNGWSVASPVGISAVFDPHAFAAGALAMFGCGWIEFGPLRVGDKQPPAGCSIHRDPAQQALLVSAQYAAQEEQLFARLGLTQGAGCQRWLRLCLSRCDGASQADAVRLIERFHDRIDAVVLEASQATAEASDGEAGKSAWRALPNLAVKPV
jgi:dihydroorotate dehydrogenase